MGGGVVNPLVKILYQFGWDKKTGVGGGVVNPLVEISYQFWWDKKVGGGEIS